MASIGKEQSGAVEGTSSGRQFQSGESLLEWRSSDQVQNGTPSSSPPYWDSDDGDDGGPKPCDLYGAFVWKINGFSQENQKELRSEPFDAGGYKWYILIYPQGCDVYNHLSLFLCVANHEKLRPGWGHYAQFTITLVNKDPNKSKYSDTLHRFWKKEHDWGWKKFVELSKVLDEFVEDNTLTIKAQVQVIRERQDRPFPCLAFEYRRELMRVYLTNVEQIFRRFVEERRGKIWKLIEDKARWSSLHSFWAGMDQSSRRSMSRTKIDAILKVVVKNFFIEKEVNSTIVMDSLYTGLISLESQSPSMKRKAKHLEREDMFFPIVHMEDDLFVLVDDVLPLLKRAAVETLPPKYERGPQHRMKDVCAGEDYYEDFSMWDERRLTQFGRRTIEIFVLTHIFSKFEVAYQEAVALRMQEELIQEEAAMLAMNELKGRRGGADKEKKSKKKQGKQKRRKGKDKGKDDKSKNHSQGMNGHDIDEAEKDILTPDEAETALEKSKGGDDRSDASDIIHPPDSEIGSVQNGTEGGSSSVMYDNSSTCSSDSFTEVVVRRPQNGNRRNKKDRNPISRGKNPRDNAVSDSTVWINGETNESTKSSRDMRVQSETSRSSPAVDYSLSKDIIVHGTERHALKKNEKPASSSVLPRKSESKAASDTPKQVDSVQASTTKLTQVPTVKPQVHVEKPSTTENKPSVSSSAVLPPTLSRPSSAPIPFDPRPVAAPTESTRPVLSRSASVSGQFGQESSSSSVPNSYRNAIMGGPNSTHTSSFVSASVSYAQATSLASSPMINPQISDITTADLNQMNPNFPFGAVSFNSYNSNNPLHGKSQEQYHHHRYADYFSSAATLDFPHLDIINDLLDDEHHGIESLSISDGLNSHHGRNNPSNNGPHFMDQQFGFPGEAVSSGPGPSTSQWHGYGSRISTYEVVPQVSLQQHRIGVQNGGFLAPNNGQWRSSSSDNNVLLHYNHRMSNVDSNGFGYHTAYGQRSVDGDGYALFRPASGR